MQSQDSLSSSQHTPAVQLMQAQQHRLSLALHYPQTSIAPSSSYSNPPNGQPTEPQLGGSGYGPPVLTAFTPVQKLVQDATELRKEYDLIVLPLTTPSWRQRFERMCLVESTSQAKDTPRASNRPSRGPQATTNVSAGPSEHEAERWRAGGGFARGEVNFTRSGWLLIARNDGTYAQMYA